MISILIALNHKLFREAIVSFLDMEKDLIIVGEVDNGASLITKYSETKPDLILADILLPEKSGIDAVKFLIRKNEYVKALFLSLDIGDDYIYYAYESGGYGLVNKNNIRAELVHAVRMIANGNKYFTGKTEKELGAIIKRFEITTRSTNI